MGEACWQVSTNKSYRALLSSVFGVPLIDPLLLTDASINGQGRPAFVVELTKFREYLKDVLDKEHAEYLKKRQK